MAGPPRSWRSRPRGTSPLPLSWIPPMSETWRNAAFSSPMSTNAAWIPGRTASTRPRKMSPTRRCWSGRSNMSSASRPASFSATQDSSSEALMSISLFNVFLRCSSPARKAGPEPVPAALPSRMDAVREPATGPGGQAPQGRTARHVPPRPVFAEPADGTATDSRGNHMCGPSHASNSLSRWREMTIF